MCMKQMERTKKKSSVGVRWSEIEQGQREEDNGHREMWIILVLAEKRPL